MKVCTDVCLFGAWAANEIQNSKYKIENIADVGAGTGLLSLMLAQKINANIDAIEIDAEAAEQGKENVELSLWKDRIAIHYSAIQKFNTSTAYDAIISNPPFFEASLKSSDERKNIAKHASGLTFEELVMFVAAHLSDEGIFFILLPYSSFNAFEVIANQHNLFVNSIVKVKQTPTHAYFRTMACFSKKRLETIEATSMNIKQSNSKYSGEFEALLKGYYLQ